MTSRPLPPGASFPPTVKPCQKNYCICSPHRDHPCLLPLSLASTGVHHITWLVGFLVFFWFFFGLAFEFLTLQMIIITRNILMP